MPDPTAATDDQSIRAKTPDTVKVTHGVTVTNTDKPIGDGEHRGLSAPQFGTRELIAFIAFIAISIVAFQVLPSFVSTGLILLGLCIFAHVAGNAVGTRLRDAGPTPKPQTSSPLQSSDYAPTTRLSLHQRLGRRAITFTILGSVVGAIGGGSLLAFVNWDNITIANMTLAIVSCAVLGGFMAFVLSSFAQVFLQAWTEAHKNADPERR